MLSEEFLPRLTSLSGSSDGQVSEQFRSKYRASSPGSFETFRQGVAKTQTIQACAGGVLMVTILFWAIVSGRHVALIFGVPAIAVAVGLAGLAIWVGSVTPQLWHLEIGRVARKNNLSVFVIGRTPIGSGYLVLGKSGVVVLSKKLEPTASFPYEELSGCTLLPSAYGVGVVLQRRDEYFELSIVLRLGGPTAQAWSNDGFIGRGRLLSRFHEELNACGISTVVVGPAARAEDGSAA